MPILTPRINNRSPMRLRMEISNEDSIKVRRGKWTANITDLNTKKKYIIRGAECSIKGCHCDAVIVQEIICKPVKKGKGK